ncbi:class I SAM-dependent methyltransferase [Mycobacterium sp. 3519A]|uniref:class I SAM-dependent methyltransferase n=1 Tax=Mycobacterium sp. 3519A TaxID=2057184 RepID=UPI00135BC657|nr:class I SAM-dependent methyltransferase [Mycobacterium sp. 3519A]
MGRVGRERDFHNNMYALDVGRVAQAKYYWAVSDGVADYMRAYQQLAPGKDVLVYGCGDTREFLKLAPVVRSLHAIDISDQAIDRLKTENNHDNVHLHVMDAMNMTFPDDSFDLVFGAGIIHHLETAAAAREVARVLRRGGRAVFWEPLGLNPLINIYRRLTPDARSVDEHPLLGEDFAIMARYLQLDDVRYYGLSTLAAVPLRNTRFGTPLLNVGRWVDKALFTLPGVKRLAWRALVIGAAK